MSNFESLIAKCDGLIREGQPGEASKIIAKLNHSRIPREWLIGIAKIARRCGSYQTGLKVLSKILGNEKLTPSPGELAEYGVLLIRIGAVAEGFSRLQLVDANQAPEALLYRTFGHFGRWEYEESVPLLETYLKSSLSDYARLVGKANLAFAYVETRRHDMAAPLLDELLAQTKSEGHQQLFTNCKALKAQIYIQEQEYAQAEKELESARQGFSLSKINDHFLVTKLHLILTGLQEKSPKPLAQLSQLATERCDWVSVREAELFSLKIAFDEARFQSLIFGTAYPAFRERALRDFDRSPGRTLYVLGPKSAPRFDVRTGNVDGAPALKPGSQVHQAIEALLRDFYEPHRIAGLFGALFPDEKFNVATSAVRVRKVLQRTRQWFADEEIPVSIREQSGFYSLHIDGAYSFIVPLERMRMNGNILQFEKFKSAVAAADSFSNQDMRTHLSLSTSAAQSLLNWAIDNGHVLKIGASKRDTRYKIK